MNIHHLFEDYQAHHLNPTNQKLHLIGIPLIIIGSLLTLASLAGGLFMVVTGAILLGFGHRAEGNKPAFVKNMTHLIIGPLWVGMELWHLISRRPSKHLVWILCMLSTLALAENPRHRKTEGGLKPEEGSGGATRPTDSRGVRKSREVPQSGSDPIIQLKPRKGLGRGEGDPKNPLQTCDRSYPIETFIQISSSSDVQATPSGIFFVSDMREAKQVFFLASPNSWPEQITFFPDGVRYYRVSPDGQKLLVGTDVGGDEQYDIYLVVPTQKKVTPLLVNREDRIESVSWFPSSDAFVFTSNTRNQIDMDLYEMSLTLKTPKLLAQLVGSQNVTDVSPDGTQIAITQFRSVTDSDIHVWDLKKKAMALQLLGNGSESLHRGLFSKDSIHLFYLSDKINGIHQLYLHDLKSQTSKALTSQRHPIEDYDLNRARTTLVYSSNEDGYNRLAGFQISREGSKLRLITPPPFKKGVVGSVSFADSFGKSSFFFSFSSPSTSSDIFLWQEPRENRWTRSTSGLIPQDCFSAEQLVSYPSFDKTEIPAFLFLPQSELGRARNEIASLPFILYVHGGPESQTRPNFNKIFQYFLQRGFGVFAPNIRGSTGYGREYTLLDNYKKRMDSVQDVIAGAKWLISLGYTESRQLAIFGGSYGGFLVLRSIEEAPDLFAAASESVGISNFVTFLEKTKPYRRILREAEYGPLSDTDFLKSISPIHYLDKLRTPLMVFHGANDPRVPVDETKQIIEALKRKGIDFEFKIFGDEGHGNAKFSNIMEQARLMSQFFEKHLKKRNTSP